MNIDTTIHLSDIFLVGGGIAAFLKMFLGQRDLNREVLTILKGPDGSNGLVGDMKRVKRDMYETGGRVSGIWHWLANLRIALAAKDIHTPNPE